MKRRDFLALAGGVPLVGMTPGLVEANVAANNHKKRAAGQRILVLVKLEGGNDGLNTLVPYQDPLYYQKRPTIAVPRHKAIPLEKNMAMNPYMKALKPIWDRGQMAWIQDVGYKHQDLSHFRSIDIWEQAINFNEHSEQGWLSHVLPRYKQGLHGIILGEGNLGALAGKDCNTVAMQSPEVFLSQVSLVDDIQHRVRGNRALEHLVNVQQQLFSAGDQLKNQMRNPRPLGVPFATSTFGRRMESVAKMIINGVDAAVYKVTHDGFDTHVKQHNTHSNLLQHLAVGLASFEAAMRKHGLWDDVLVMTYSEFGRRVQENHGRGTDHGAASVQLAMGGRVKGGIYGDNPRLHDLDVMGNLPASTDFRSIYSSVAQRWFRQPHPWKKHSPILFV